MNEFELRKYYSKFKVAERLHLSYKGFMARIADDRDYARDVHQGIIAFRAPHVKQRVLEGTLNFG